MISLETWLKVARSDPRARALADRHYSRQTIGALDFMPPGRVLVLLTPDARSVWGSHWPFAHLTHDGLDAWRCTIFRKESDGCASDMILEAIAVTRLWWGEPPPDGFITFVAPGKIRRKRDPGRCFLRAGFLYECVQCRARYSALPKDCMCRTCHKSILTAKGLLRMWKSMEDGV